MKEVARYSNCFVCGDKNTHGLKARFYYDGHEAFTEIVTDKKFEGYRQIFHGGIISTLLDEVMIKAILAQDKLAVTVELSIRYHHPLMIGEKIRFTGKIIEQKKRLFITEGKAVSTDGKVFATAEGKYIEAGPQMAEQLKKSID